MKPLDGRVALVTGASRGIGAAAARALAAAGAQVVIADLTCCDQLASDIGAKAVALDVTSEQGWRETMEELAADGGLDILVNNAGVALTRPVSETSLDDWRRVQAVNVEGVFLGCKFAIPLLAARAKLWSGGSAIINVSSTAGLVGAAGFCAYSASKGAVRLFTKSLALEVAKKGIRVNSVYPGTIATEMLDGLVANMADRSGLDPDEMRRKQDRAIPLGKSGVPKNIADAIAFLASDAAAFMTGSELIVDGGMTAQ